MTSTKNGRIGEYSAGQSVLSKDQSGLGIPNMGTFGNSAWNSGGIWASKGSTIGSGIRTGETSRSARSQFTGAEPFGPQGNVDLSILERSGEISGSGSLLSSSESEGYTNARRNSTQWPALGSTTLANGLATARNGHGSTSPVRSRTNQHTRSNSPYHNNQLPAIGTAAAPKPQSHLDPTVRTFNSSGLFSQNHLQGNSSRQNGSDIGRSLESHQIGNVGANGANAYSGYASSAASRSGSLPPSRHGNEPVSGSGFGDLAPGNPFQSTKSEIFTHRRNEPSRSSNFSTTASGRTSDTNWGLMNDLSNGINRLDVGRDTNESFANGWDSQYQVTSPTNIGGPFSGFHRNGSMSLDPESRMSQNIPQQLRGFQNPNQLSFGDMVNHSPGGHDARQGQDSPLYMSNTPPLPDHHRTSSMASHRGSIGANNYNNPSILDRKLRHLQEIQQQQHGNVTTPAALAYRQSPFSPYANNMPQLARMNFNQPYYPGVSHMNGYNLNGGASHRIPPRGPAIDNQEATNLRSPLMEEFRSSKGNRKYELKDIYNHVVEFSGDQHGSRFIQQKLEGANSDEKAQLFSEILPNAWQLMTDVFGNYVIQKFFEHGNQTQKKQLADKMKGHITDLSLQMYGCRVVQKAFEHILTDQQAALVKELEPDILKCIKDQNGNHVIQKAIQRIPPEHITFINAAVSGNVHPLAAHSYGCRVIQRMLEFCPPPARDAVIDELHAYASNLITDQYGNYVIQNVMDHGRDEDRNKLIEMTIDKVLSFSRHKYASNVVEHSLRKGTEDQRKRIVEIVRGVDKEGESRLIQLVRDQYGNYVIQTIIKILEGQERKDFMAEVRAHVEKVRHFSYGKHIGQIDRLINEKTQELAEQQLTVESAALDGALPSKTGNVQSTADANTAAEVPKTATVSDKSDPNTTANGTAITAAQSA